MYGACGKMKRPAGEVGSSSSGITVTKSVPSAPKPCSQMTEKAGVAPVERSIGFSYKFAFPDVVVLPRAQACHFNSAARNIWSERSARKIGSAKFSFAGWGMHDLSRRYPQVSHRILWIKGVCPAPPNPCRRTRNDHATGSDDTGWVTWRHLGRFPKDFAERSSHTDVSKGNSGCEA